MAITSVQIKIKTYEELMKALENLAQNEDYNWQKADKIIDSIVPDIHRMTKKRFLNYYFKIADIYQRTCTYCGTMRLRKSLTILTMFCDKLCEEKWEAQRGK